MKNNSNLRVSSYVIISEIPEHPEKFILVHSYSGALDIVSSNVAKCLSENTTVDNNVINEYYLTETTIEILKKRCYLTERSVQEERSYVSELADVIKKTSNHKSGFVCLVTYDCNFRCPYCYENGISNSGKSWTKKAYDIGLVDRFYQAIEELEHQVENHTKEILLYGGEPLLEKNSNVVNYLVEKGFDRGFSFEAVTNGYDLDKYENLLGPDKIKQIQITLDGPEEHHNKRRIHFKNHDSFRVIIDNLKRALSKDVEVAIRINTDIKNINSIITLFEELDRNNVLNYKKLNIYSMPVDTGEKDFELYNGNYVSRCTNEFNKEFLKQIYKLINENPLLSKLKYQNSKYEKALKISIGKKELIPFEIIFCGSQSNMLVFDPYGDLYTCWEVVGRKEFCVGQFAPQLSIDEKKISLWRNRNILTNKICSRCKYALLCGGGCVGKAALRFMTFDSVFCDNFQDSFRTIAGETAKEYLEKKLA